VLISRTVRFSVNPAGRDSLPARANTFAGWPSMRGLGSHHEIEVRCSGTPDPLTGYLLSISVIDRLVRDHVLPIVELAVAMRASAHPGRVLADVLEVLRRELGSTLDSVCWRLSPYYAVAMDSAVENRVLVNQQFEFSAAHRLHCPDLDDQANRRIFGKCNNANGHGHNYRIEVAVIAPLDSPAGGPIELERLERIVDQTIIQRFDHKHLNLDTAEFARLNPSVENISRVCHDLLSGPIQEAGANLHHVTIWETAKTSCTYPAPVLAAP
jgi:6-pyruvoyltetrahydropterin/6-carboxytetrahydropterin synthase